MVIQEDSLEIKFSKMSKIMEVDVAALEARVAREAMENCNGTMMQTVVLNAIIVENQAI